MRQERQLGTVLTALPNWTGSAPKRLLSSSVRNLLRVRMGTSPSGDKARLDVHTLIAKGSSLRLTKMHVLVEPNRVSEAEQWAQMAMAAAYEGW